MLLSLFLLADTVRAESRPLVPYAEQRGATWLLNHDFVLRNDTGDTMSVQMVEVEARDAHGALLARRFLDDNGTRPSIEALGPRRIAPHDSLLVFNPFVAWDELPARLTYRFVLKAGDAQRSTTIEVKPVAYRSRTRLGFPLTMPTLVYDGHDALSHHRRFDYLHPVIRQVTSSNMMRYAYDFCPVNAAGAMHEGDPARNESWIGFGAPVLATGDGIVVAASDGAEDNRRFDEAAIFTTPMVLYGNHIVIDHGNGEFSLFGHLKQGSLAVRVGDRVRAGQVIAAVGASGSANIPHLHYELRNGNGIRVEGLPSYFGGVRRAGISGRGPVQVDTGDLVTR